MQFLGSLFTLQEAHFCHSIIIYKWESVASFNLLYINWILIIDISLPFINSKIIT